MNILIADDNHTERLILSRVLEQEGHQVVEADNGLTALELFRKHQPEMIFLDVLMPGMDGYDVAFEIKKEAPSWIPIIFLTSLTDAQDLAKCIDSGGDDFVSKPINRIIIKAKINAFRRISDLYETIEQQSQQLQFHNEHLIQEQEAAKKIFNNIAHKGCLTEPNIHYHLSPMSIFNGDLMLAAETPMGGMRLMLADFTGHGLPAAIGAMPASEIFYGMTKKGFNIPDLMTEMNTRLYDVLPRGIFCCVVVMDIDMADNRLTIWNAGAPDAFLLDQKTGEIKTVSSSHLPLGVQSPKNFAVEPLIFGFGQEHKVFAITDGIIESTNAEHEMFGDKRLRAFLEQNIKQDNLVALLTEEVVKFTGEADQGDDLSLLEVSYPREFHQTEDEDALDIQNHSGTLDSSLCLELRARSLGKFDPIPLFLQTILECRALVSHRSRIFTILSELYNNALEHGVLGLDSATKSGGEGFARYYHQRAEGLATLSEGFVRVEVDHRPTEDGGELIFDIKDSGKGFDFETVKQKGCENYSGRGLPLLLNLCHSIEAFDQGRHLRAIYRWRHDDE